MGVARTTVKLTAAAYDTARRSATHAASRLGSGTERWPPHGLVVLLYHRVGGHSGLEIDLPRPLFRDQISELASAHRVVSLTEGLACLADPSAGRELLVSVTFDDGTTDFTDNALPVLVDHRLPVTLYVATDFVEQRRNFPLDGVPLTWSALRDALSTGLVDVGSHTHTHAVLDRLPPDRVAGELDRSIDLVREHTGTAPVHFAYPKAVPGTREAEVLVRARFRSAALAGTHVNRYGSDPYRLARSPVQQGDGMRWFRHKAAGGLALEDTLRRLLNRGRYAGAAT